MGFFRDFLLNLWDCFLDLWDETNSCWHLKMDAWNTIVSFLGRLGLFSGAIC